MAITGPAELLATWEAGLAQPAPGRALLLHRAARPEADDGELLSVAVGEREADLFALRRALFGERLQVRIDCVPCGEAMEFDLSTDELAARPREQGPLRVEEDGWAVEFRLPTVADLTAVAHEVAARGAVSRGGTGPGAPDGTGAPGPAEGSGTARGSGSGPGSGAAAGPALEARRLLLARCVVAASRAGRALPAGRLPELPESVQRRIAEAAEEADPAAAVTLNVACPECGEATKAELDIASYLWTELDSWARDLLLDVHLLAGAYGWSEREILALSPLRRRYYLELCADA
ncbi:hypothetical protein [Streptomyces lycii]|uniref:Phage baseplate protein n=1 Tax=Streptomyces lycii TaxID=2654337 RepID=A0ABQ7FC86_9ACTN|nr:hypothetical protein [Streptomyces lycii]KAF4406240.1 hypothetical protein GCU69_25940 [Streptomyces lycii]